MRLPIVAAVLVVASAVAASGQAPTSIQQPGTIVQPSVIREVKPQYPDAALAAGRSGEVTLECVVNPDGSVGEVRVITSLDPSLDAEAVKALKQWQFKPGSKDGKPVPVAVTVEVTFSVRHKGPSLDSAEVFKPGGTVTHPKAVKEVRPSYPPEVMRAGVTGMVDIECVVLPDGTVGDARTVAPLHPQLDAESLKAVRQWRFEPGRQDGKPVPVQVTIQMTFTLR
jgi:TonB family protein